MTQKLLFQLDTDPQPSVFDCVVGFDGGAEHVLGHAGVRAESVAALVNGAIYTRGTRDKRCTALFVGGSDLARGEAVLEAVRACFFGNFRVSVMLDSNGCNTTAAAAVALIGQAAPLSGARAVVLAGTGPVGMRVAAMLAREGASVTITGRQAVRTEDAAAAIGARHGATVAALAAVDEAARVRAIAGATVVVAAGAPGLALLPEAAWRDAPGLAVVADLNPRTPSGIGGVAAGDRGATHGAVRAFGALGIGGLKLRLHRACIGRLFERNDLVLDVAEILELAKGMV